MRKSYRKGLKAMEKPATTSSKYRTQFWYIAMASFLLWIFLLYLFNSSAITVHSHERLFKEGDTNFTVLDPVSVVSDENLGDDDDSSLPVSGDEGRDHTSDDAKVVNDIVEELEKVTAENEKKKKRFEVGGGESFLRGRSRAKRGNRDWIVRRERESRKARSLDRLGSKKKRSDQEKANYGKKKKTDDDNDREAGGDDDDNVVDKKRKQRDSENRSSAKDIDEAENFFEAQKGVELQKDRSKDVFEDKNAVELQKDRSEKDFETKTGVEIRKDQFKKDFEAKNGVEQQKGRAKKAFEPKNDAKSQRDRSKNRARSAQNVMIRQRETYPNDPCIGKYIYVHEIPTLFNDELLKNCWTLSRWTDMCELTSNLGLGPRLPDMERVSGWFATNQFTLEVIFHNRMKQYKCLTKDSSLASAVFVPYYAGLDVMRFLWGPFPYMRDAAALDLMKWLREKPEWKRMNGRDHFMVAGRTTWDFMRTPENESDWGNRLMILPEPRNMTMLLIESSPWNYHGFAIPYPTYFHPSSDSEILQWQNRMRRIKRRYLFSFVGAPRPNLGDSIRGEIMDQCRASRRKCKLLECVSGSQKCYKPDQIMKFFLSSTFCLQPPGDSYTRRSTFDSILAGCIPVFFHPGSAYAQYVWHLPKDYTRYSVFIPVRDVKEGRVSIERVLNRIPRAKVVAMREEVIRLISKVMYFDPRKRVEGFEDAFDLTVKGVLERTEGIRRRMETEKEEMFEFPEELSWKYNMFGNVEGHEWDSYFDRP